jgi:hypothetical protein
MYEDPYYEEVPRGAVIAGQSHPRQPSHSVGSRNHVAHTTNQYPSHTVPRRLGRHSQDRPLQPSPSIGRHRVHAPMASSHPQMSSDSTDSRLGRGTVPTSRARQYDDAPSTNYRTRVVEGREMRSPHARSASDAHAPRQMGPSRSHEVEQAPLYSHGYGPTSMERGFSLQSGIESIGEDLQSIRQAFKYSLCTGRKRALCVSIFSLSSCSPCRKCQLTHSPDRNQLRKHPKLAERLRKRRTQYASLPCQVPRLPSQRNGSPHGRP